MNILNIIAAALLAVAAALAVTSHQFVRKSAIASGRVTELIAQRGPKGGTIYKVVAEFRDSSRNVHTYRSSFASSNPGYAVGDPIRICYRAGTPSDCGVYSFGYRFGAAWISACMALAVVAISLGFRHGQRVMDAVYLRETTTVELR